MSKESQYQLRVPSEKQEVKRMRLLTDTFKVTDEFLKWKYDLNPDFDRSLIVVAENYGQVVGCASWLPRNLKILKSLSVRSALGADLAVHPNHRGRGLSKLLIASESTVLEGKDIIMSYGFANAKLVEHVHAPFIGLIKVPTSTIVYKKHLNLSEIREKVAEINRIVKGDKEMKKKIADLDMTVLFHLRGTPAFTLRICPDEIRLQENDLTEPDLKVECDLTFLDLFKSKVKFFALINALSMRKIRIKGSLKDSIKLYSLSKLLAKLIE